MTQDQGPVMEAPRADLSELTIDRHAGMRRRGALRRPRVRLFIAIAVTALGLATWAWRQHAPLPVKTAIVSSFSPSQGLTILNATGYVVAQRKASVASKASGRLEWLGVLEGSRVSAGEVIARLESRDAMATRDQAAANVQLAEANLDQGRAELLEAQRSFSRYDALVAKNFVSMSAYDNAVGRLSKARAAVAGYRAAIAVAKAYLRVTEVALDQTNIRAPFNGVVLTRNANVGDTITPFSQAGDTKGAVVTIADIDTLEVEVDVSETSSLDVQVGQPVDIQIEAIPGRHFKGVVNRLVPAVDRAKASTLVKVRFLERDPRMLSDMSAKVAFLKRALGVTEQRTFLAVPAAAIFDSEGHKQVFVIADGKAQLRNVTLGATAGDKVEVRSLAAGTRVVVRPPDLLRNGRSVSEGTK